MNPHGRFVLDSLDSRLHPVTPTDLAGEPHPPSRDAPSPYSMWRITRRGRPDRSPKKSNEMDATKKPVSHDPEVMGGELVFAGTRVEVKTISDYPKAGHSLDDFLQDFLTVSREQAEAYLETALRAAGDRVPADARR